MNTPNAGGSATALFLTENAEGAAHITDLLAIAQEKNLTAQQFETIRARLNAIPLHDASAASIGEACDTASRMANRFFDTHSVKPSTSSVSAGSSTDRRDDRPTADDHSAKRARTEGARGPANAENINPDRGAEIKRRHEGFMTAVVEKSLYEKCSTEGQIFSPMLVSVNELQNQLLQAMAKLASEVLDCPHGEILAKSEEDLADLPSALDVDTEAPIEDLRAAIERISELALECLRHGKQLKAATKHAMRCFWLANHTHGANWETVKQLLYREQWDREAAAFDDEAVTCTEKKWDEKVAIAMKRIDQNHGLAKDGALLGPICPGIARGHGPGRRPFSEVNRDTRKHSGGSARRGRDHKPDYRSRYQSGGRRSGGAGGRSRDSRSGRDRERRDDRDGRESRDQRGRGDRSRADAGAGGAGGDN
jgi:uncharacterized membrane protein YgcG